MPYISPTRYQAHVPYSRERGMRMNDASRVTRVERKRRERIQRKTESPAVRINDVSRARITREKKDSLMRIRWLLSYIRLSPSALSHLQYGRHRLPLAVSQRSLCNILSSRERRAIRFRVRVRTTLVCVSPGQVNVLRLAVRRERRAARKKGANARGRDIRQNPVLQILRLPSRPLPPPMNALLPVRKRAYTLSSLASL